MKPLALLLAGALAAAPVIAAKLYLDDDEVVECNAGGGCLVVTQRYIDGLVKAAFEHGRGMCPKAGA